MYRSAGFNNTPGERMTYFPNVTLVMGCGFLLLWLLLVSVDVEVDVVDGAGRTRSPRMQTEGERTQRPPRVMCWVPCSWARRETLLPVSVSTQVEGAGGLEGGIFWGSRGAWGGGGEGVCMVEGKRGNNGILMVAGGGVGCL